LHSINTCESCQVNEAAGNPFTGTLIQLSVPENK
jgi:hypothetical protein